MAESSFKIAGMDCAEEVAVLKSELGPLPGIENLAFDVLNGKMSVAFDQTKVSEEQIVRKVDGTGMKAEKWQETSLRDSRKGISVDPYRAVLTGLSGLLIVGGFLVQVILQGWMVALGGEEGWTPLVVVVIYVVSALLGASLVAPKAWQSLRRIRPDMNLLMFVAVGGAIAIGQFAEAATVAFLFSVSLMLESWSVSRARRAIEALMELSPETATVLEDNGKESVREAKDVPVGALVLVRPGERFPLDGRISKGETTVNQAPITGESAPVPKVEGAEVFAGTINGEGAVEFKTTKLVGDTTLSRIVKLVGDAQSKRSRSEQWVEVFARYYTPAVMCLAILVTVIPPLLLGEEWSKWLYQGLALLVIACPCALVISTPVSIVAAMASAANAGVLVKGGANIEVPATLVAVALDKTGTLTEGRPEVLEVVPLSGHTAREVLEIAASLEARSQHPLAQAVIRKAKAEGIETTSADDFQAISGKGATAKRNGRPIWIGSHRLLEERGQETPEMHELANRFSAEGKSVIVLGEDRHVCGFIAVGDAIRKEAADALRAMRNVGIERVIMLTGDNRGTGEAVGAKVGVDEVLAELLPEEKVKAVEDLVRRYKNVAMVGDGVNDAPAMARATLGIAMGAVGTDAALETADIALMSDDLSKLAWLITHSRRTMAIIRQNIFAAISVKVVFVGLTFLGHSSLWLAIAADAGVSLLVVANGLRLLRGQRDVGGKARF